MTASGLGSRKPLVGMVWAILASFAQMDFENSLLALCMYGLHFQQ